MLILDIIAIPPKIFLRRPIILKKFNKGKNSLVPIS